MKRTYPYEQLERLVVQVFLKMGCRPDQAEKAADILITADLRGIDSHGVARLSGYVRLWEVGFADAQVDNVHPGSLHGFGFACHLQSGRFTNLICLF